jgi:glutamate carboxypeptidase
MNPSLKLSDSLKAELASVVDKNFEAHHVPFLRTLVEQASHTYATNDVEAAAQIMDRFATELDLSIEQHPDPEGQFAAHRVYRTPATEPTDSSIGLVGHIDTVFPRSLGFLSFSRDQNKGTDSVGNSPSGEAPAAAGDTVRGPGVLDMKSGLSAIFFAMRAIKESAPALYQKLQARFICVSDEEVGSPSSHALFSQLAPVLNAALVFEAGRDEDKIVTRRKGSGGFKITAHGRAAHAGNKHQEGLNAIHALALLIPQLEAITDYTKGLTVNVGLMEGGSAKNTVPETAHCTIDCRFERTVDVKDLESRLRDICSNPFPDGVKPGRLSDVRFILEGGVSRPPMEATPESQSLRLAYESHAEAAGLRIGEAPLQGGGSDANLLAAHGVPSIDGLGPYGKHFHKVQEWSSLASLQKRTLALCWFLAERIVQRET